MSSTQLLAKQRDALDLSNRALFDQVQGLKAAQQVAEERKGLQDQLDELTMSSTQLLAKQRAALDESNRALFDQIQAVKAAKDSASAVLGGVSDMYSALQKVVSREKSAIQTSVDTHTAAFNKLQSLSQALHSTLDSLQSPEQKLFARSMAQAEIRTDLAITKAGGTLSDAQVESLKKALGAVTQDASKQFGSREDYMFDLLRTQNDIAQLGDITDDSLSIEQKSLDALNDQLKRLDEIVTNGQAQIDALNGQSVATLSLAQALAAFQSSIAGAKSNPVVGGTSTVAGFYQDLLGRAPDQAGMQFWKDQIASGTSLDAIRAAIMGSDEYKKLHPFAVGTNFVPETMPALVHQGERIIPAADNRALMARLSSPGGNSEALAAEIKALREEVQGLREEARATTAHSAKTAGLLKRVIRNDSLITSTVGTTT
jgi:predicted  nucleic acid-binding Zn-ribbon protein